MKSPVCQQQIKRETAEEAPWGDSQGTQAIYIYIYSYTSDDIYIVYIHTYI